MCWQRIIKLFRKKKPEPEGKPQGKRKAYEGTPVTTWRGGPNMPKCQTCPDCRASSARTEKTEGGAYYRCHNHGEFFVKRARRRPSRPVYQHSR